MISLFYNRLLYFITHSAFPLVMIKHKLILCLNPELSLLLKYYIMLL